MFGISTLLGLIGIGVKVAEISTGKGKDKAAQVMKTVAENPIAAPVMNAQLLLVIQNELLPVIVKIAHLTGEFKKTEDTNPE